MDTYISGDIFWRKKKSKWRMPKTRWFIGGIVVALTIALFAFTPAQNVIKAQDVDPNNWWHKGEIGTLEPIPTLPPENPAPIGTNNPSDLQQSTNAIIQIQQQIQSEMSSCVQNKNQGFNLLVNQTRHVNRLQAQHDSINDAIARETDLNKIDVLQNQENQIQQQIDKLNGDIADTQSHLDSMIADCRNRISDLQSRQDELEANLSDQFKTLLDYEVPN